MPKNGNITGQVFDEDVIKQIEARQNFLGARYRTDANLIYSNNSNAFLRLASSINVGTSASPIEFTPKLNKDQQAFYDALTNNVQKEAYLKSLKESLNSPQAQVKAQSDLLSQGRNQLAERGIDKNLTGMELAKACVLFGGTVGIDNLLNPKFKYGIVDNGGSGTYDYVSTIAAYGWGGISSKGFVPMPSIESADVSFFNRGALQKATVKIKVYSLEQLQIFDILYFRIGYTMLLEWGHNIWLDNDLENNPNPINERREFATDPFKLFFNEGSTQQDIIKAVHSQRKKENYNYDAMLGKVTNFTWKFNEDGSYDIDLNLVGLGDIIESLKVNKANIVTDKVELTPTQIDQKKQANITAGYKVADAKEETAGDNVTTATGALETKVNDVNKELAKIVKNIKDRVKLQPSKTTATDSFKANVTSLNVTVGQDEATNTAAGAAIQGFEAQLTAWRNAWVRETKKSYGVYDSTFGSIVEYLKGKAEELRTQLRLITGEDLASVKDAEKAAEQAKREADALRRGLDAASQKLKRDEEIRQLSPIASVESKNKTALNLRLYNWRLDAQNGVDKKNLFNLLLTANSANPSATGTPTLSLNFYYVRLGYFLEWVESNLLLYDPTKPPTPSNYERALQTGTLNNTSIGNQIFTIDTNPDTNFCLRFPAQFSADPKVCVIPSQYKDDNAEWNILPELKDYIVPDNAYVGKLMNIFVNIDYIAGCLDQNTDVNGKTNLLKFLTTIFNGMNDVLGNVNKMEPVFDSENNQLKIIEGSSLEKIDELIADREKKDNNMAVFQVYGIGTTNNPYGSFITNVDFQVQLPPNMAAMATISAQSRGNIVGENATGLSKLNLGFTDRLITLKLDKDSIEGVETGKADPKEIFKTNIQAVSKFVNGLYKDKLYAKDTVESTRSSNRDVALYLTGNDALDNKMPSPFFIPFNLSLTMNGLSGMRNYERFSITEQILPYSYRSGDQKGVIDFLIKGISHSIKDNKWETKIESLTVGSNRKWKIKDLQ
jgi:hypothetical protein